MKIKANRFREIVMSAQEELAAVDSGRNYR